MNELGGINIRRGSGPREGLQCYSRPKTKWELPASDDDYAHVDGDCTCER
jgi:hypothetical protein